MTSNFSRKGKKKKFPKLLIMNWYKSIKLSDQALPGITDRYDIEDQESFGGYKYVDQEIDEIKKVEEEQAFPFLQNLTPQQIKERVKAGNTGIIYTYGNVVIKYTPETNEYECAKTIIDMQKEKGGRVPGFVEIYDATKLYEEETLEQKHWIYRLILERVIPLKDYDEKMYHILTVLHGSPVYGYDACFNETGEYSPDDQKMIDTIFDDVKSGITYMEPYTLRSIEPPQKIIQNTTREDVYQVIYKYCELFHKIIDAGASATELHTENIGITDDGEWVILDVGGTF